MDGRIDLDLCDREKIHLIGAVQPHGCLIALDEVSGRIRHASTNCIAILGRAAETLLGQECAALLGPENARALSSLPLDPAAPEQLKPWFVTLPGAAGSKVNLECLPHRSGDQIVLEFLPGEDPNAPIWQEEALRQGIVAELLKPGALEDLAETAARMIREATGFDRVMIYRFAEDKHGQVIAESTDRPDRFLGQHYPASDIPDPARRHFTLNLIRTIPDIDAPVAPILSEEAAALDLTYSKLRAVAPVHLEYLRNMGVGASLSISLITHDRLWGLVACHHYGPRQISSNRLRFAELLGATTSTLLQSHENTRLLRKSIAAEQHAYRVEQDGRRLRDLIAPHGPALMALFAATGLILVQGDRHVTCGTCPDHPLDLTALLAQSRDGIATTATLAAHSDLPAEAIATAAGAALLELSEDGQDYLLLFRPEFEETIAWAGKPEKTLRIGADGTPRLSPRGSFAVWREERRGQSKPFDAADRDALRILRRALFALNSFEREQAARADEARSRHALLEATRAGSMGELASAIAHELNQPLSAVANYVTACRQELRNAGIDMPGPAAEMIDEAVRETLRAGDLMQRVRDLVSSGALSRESHDLNQTIRQAVDLALDATPLPGLRLDVTLDSALPPVLADPVQIGQVVLNLVRNSLTAMKDTEDQRLTVTIAGQDNKVQVSVRDSGTGIAPELQDSLFEPFHASTTQGMGIGLSLCRSIVEAHGGTIRSAPVAEGALILFDIPIDEPLP